MASRASKGFTVHFHTTSVGAANAPLSDTLPGLIAQHGPNLPRAAIGDGEFQIRDLRAHRDVITGVFAKLRDDAPHVINVEDTERKLRLRDGDQLLERCHFLYHLHHDLVTWQSNRMVGNQFRFARYLSEVLNTAPVFLPDIFNRDALERILAGEPARVEFKVARPQQYEETRAPQWEQSVLDLMSTSTAKSIAVTLSAERGDSLGASVRAWIRRMARGNTVGEVERLKVRLAGESETIDLLAERVTGRITVAMDGLYPVPDDVYHRLNECYVENRAFLRAYFRDRQD